MLGLASAVFEGIEASTSFPWVNSSGFPPLALTQGLQLAGAKLLAPGVRPLGFILGPFPVSEKADSHAHPFACSKARRFSFAFYSWCRIWRWIAIAAECESGS